MTLSKSIDLAAPPPPLKYIPTVPVQQEHTGDVCSQQPIKTLYLDQGSHCPLAESKIVDENRCTTMFIQRNHLQEIFVTLVSWN